MECGPDALTPRARSRTGAESTCVPRSNYLQRADTKLFTMPIYARIALHAKPLARVAISTVSTMSQASQALHIKGRRL